MTFNRQLAQAVAEGVSIQQIESAAQQNGMQTLKESGIEKLCQGVTSLQELQRVLFL